MMRVLALIALTSLACRRQSERPSDTAAKAPERSTLEQRRNTSVIVRSAGGSARTNLGYGIVLNDKSSLTREWITVHDSVLPLDFVGNPGIETNYLGSGYKYTAQYDLRAADTVRAFEVRCSVFDVWGAPLRTLSHTEVEDLPAGTTRRFQPRWDLYSENEASEYYASICFVARVRTASGRIVAANMDPIITEALHFSDRFAPADLEPRALPTRP